MQAVSRPLSPVGTLPTMRAGARSCAMSADPTSMSEGSSTSRLKVLQPSWNTANNEGWHTFLTKSADATSMPGVSLQTFKVLESSRDIANKEGWRTFLTMSAEHKTMYGESLQVVSRSLSPVGTLPTIRVGANPAICRRILHQCPKRVLQAVSRSLSPVGTRPTMKDGTRS